MMKGMSKEKVRFNPTAIRQARFHKGLKQQGLADLMGVSRNTIIRAEGGECSEKLGRRIADALGVLAESLMYDESKHAVPPEGLAITGAEKQLLVGFREMDLLCKKVVLRFVTEVVSGEAPVAALAMCLRMCVPEHEAGPPRP